jgi:O-antigen/teichoic acid export membrane protein
MSDAVSVQKNIVANFVGSAWSAIMGLVFIPLYIRYLGMEAYGLIGVFALLQAWLVLLDAGLTPTLNREMARFEAGMHTPQSIRDLVRSVEMVYALIAAFIVIGVALAAPWMATGWLKVETLPTVTVVEVLSVTGLVVALRWLGGLYRGAINGLQRQVWLNGCTAVFSTLRGLGVVGILAWVSSTILAFFIYQGALAALETLVLAVQMRRLLPVPSEAARFRWSSLRKVWRFAAGMSVITVLAILLTQMDKLLLSKLLRLTEFGYYTLASTVAGALYLLISPISNATYPRLTELVARGETSALAESYHKFSQLITLMIVPAALVLSLFAGHVLMLWTRDVTTTASVAPLVSLLVIGTMFNGLMYTPYTLQLANGWTRLTVTANAVSVLLLAPAIYIGVSAYGATAAAVIWIILNMGYVAVALPVMHRRLLRAEMWRWYGQDVFVPGLAAFAAAGFVRLLAPVPALERPFESIAVLAAAAVAALGAAIVATPLGRSQVYSYFRPAIQPQ